MIRRLLIAALALAGIAWGASKLFEAERMRPWVRASLEQSLRRRVEINGGMDYLWLSGRGPGWEINDVVIHEDDRLGREPIAYVTTLEATPDWMSLLRDRVAFSTLTLVEPSLNLMLTAQGEVNIQPFLAGLLSVRDSGGPLPLIRVRAGRVNFKRDLDKLGFYLTGTDLDLRPTESNGFNISLSTEAARTDRPPMGYGSFSAQGRLRFLPEREPELDLTLDLDRSALADVLVLFEGRRGDLSGRVSARTRIAGPLSRLEWNGRIDLEGFQRWNLPGFQPGALTLFYRGRSDLGHGNLQLDSVRDPKASLPVQARLRVADAFSRPRWGLVISAQDLPLAVLTDGLRAIGFRMGTDADIVGTATGAVGISAAWPVASGSFAFHGDGFSGEYRLLREEIDAHHVSWEADRAAWGPLQMRSVRVRAAGSGEGFSGTVEAKGLRGELQLAATENRLHLVLSDGRKLTGRAFPPELDWAKDTSPAPR